LNRHHTPVTHSLNSHPPRTRLIPAGRRTLSPWTAPQRPTALAATGHPHASSSSPAAGRHSSLHSGAPRNTGSLFITRREWWGGEGESKGGPGRQAPRTHQLLLLCVGWVPLLSSSATHLSIFFICARVFKIFYIYKRDSSTPLMRSPWAILYWDPLVLWLHGLTCRRLPPGMVGLLNATKGAWTLLGLIDYFVCLGLENPRWLPKHVVVYRM
jgi:hypothetical protein